MIMHRFIILTGLLMLPISNVRAQQVEENLFEESSPTEAAQSETSSNVCVVKKIDQSKHYVVLRCKDSIDGVSKRQKMDLNWEGKSGPKSRAILVAKTDSGRHLIWARYGKKNPGNLPRKGWKVSVSYSMESIPTQPEQAQEEPREEKEEKEEKRERRDEKRDWEFFDSNPMHRLEIGYGTSISNFFKVHILDVRASLAFFHFPIFLEIGLQPSYGSFTLSAVKMKTIGVHIPVNIRLDMNLGKYFTVALAGGGEVVGFGYRDPTDPTHTTTTSTTMFDYFTPSYAAELIANFSRESHFWFRFGNEKKLTKVVKYGWSLTFGYGYYF